MISLAEIAHARAGDKGSNSIIMVAPYDPADYVRLRAVLDVESVAAHFGLSRDKVAVNAADGLGAVSLVLRDVLDGGVTRSARVDPHGKTLSGHLLELQVPWKDA